MSEDLLDTGEVAEIPLKYIERQNQVNFAMKSLERGMTKGNTRLELENKGYSARISELLVEEGIISLREKRRKNGKNELWGGIVLALFCLPLVFFARYLIVGVVAGIGGIIKGAADIKASKATF